MVTHNDLKYAQAHYATSLPVIENQLRSSSDITRTVVGRKSMSYQITKTGAGLKLSHHLPICTMSDHFQNFSITFFFVNWKWNFERSELANSNRRTKQRFANMLSALIDVIITWARTKILREKTKWTVRVLKVCKLTFGIKKQTKSTLV